LNDFTSGKIFQGREETQGIQTLKDNLISFNLVIKSSMDNLKTLQGYAQSRHPEMVICHTDIHGGNLMKGHDGELYLLDWENAMIAPPEHDLMFFAGEPGFIKTFYPVYSRCYIPHKIEFKLLEFYFYRRSLEDLADFIIRIMSGSGTNQQDQEDYQECLDILKHLPEIQKTIDKIKVMI
jgi:thiamine kinase-like enzyme